MVNTTTNALVTAVQEQASLKTGTFLIGIDGPGGSGKSSLGRLLSRELDAALVEGDDFYRDLDEEERWNLTPEEGASFYFDWQRLRDEVLVPSAEGREVTFRRFDWDNRRGLSISATTIFPSKILIVEGVYTCRPELSALYDLRVVVEADEEIRLARMFARGHGNEQWIPKWEAAQNHYFDNLIQWDLIDLLI